MQRENGATVGHLLNNGVNIAPLDCAGSDALRDRVFRTRAIQMILGSERCRIDDQQTLTPFDTTDLMLPTLTAQVLDVASAS